MCFGAEKRHTAESVDFQKKKKKKKQRVSDSDQLLVIFRGRTVACGCLPN
jgi:hypothetical protein